MAYQIETSLYQTLADAYAAIDVSLSSVSTDARTALDAILNVTTSYGDPSGNADAALEIELALLGTFNTSYVSSTNIVNSVGYLLDAVRALNNHVINNTSGSATAKSKLDTWINTTMGWSSVPGGWKNLCTDAGYNTTDWT